MPSNKNQLSKKRCPLEGIKILDLSTQIPGPYCSMLLADLGADVIKIENTDDIGDPTRLLPYLFNNVNRNKKSICLNLKSSEAQKIFYKMSETVDVLIEGFRPGVCKKLNIDYTTIKDINPQILYCSITGYGQEGPYKDKPGHDINYLGYSGLLSLESDLKKSSNISAIPVADLAGSMYAVVSILAALIHRDKTGIGQYLDVSMTASAFSLMGASIAAGLKDEKENASLYIPHYGVFKTKDDKHLTLGIMHEEHFWKHLCSVIDMGDLAKLDLFNRIARRDEISDRLQKRFIKMNLTEWITILDDADVPCGPVYNIEESYSDPQMMHRKSVFEMDHPAEGKTKHRAFPVKFSESIIRKDLPPPTQGMQTKEIMHGLGYAENEIDRLTKEKVVK